jgi:hypothetical protein
MSDVDIAEIRMGADGRVCVRPKAERFPHIYRAAMGIGWEETSGELFGGPSADSTSVQWFDRIIAAVEDEYGVRLRLAPSTLWLNVPRDVRTRIETSAG